MKEAQQLTPKQEYEGAILWSRIYMWLMVGAILLLGGEVIRISYEWLRFGEIEGNTLADWMGRKEFRWVGVQKIVDFLLALPIWLVSIFLMLGFGWASSCCEDEAKHLGKKL